MKITIITVCYNAAYTLEKTILSVIEQTYPNIEYIIIDGKSTDTTISIIKRYETHISRWISEVDKGVFDAMNKGLTMATGDYVIFMNAGDSFAEKNIIEKVVNYIMNNKNADVYYGDIYRDIKSSSHIWKDIPFYLNKKKLKGMNICHQAIFTKLSTAKKYNFDTSYKVAADYNMMMQIFQNGGSFKYIPLNVAIYDTTGISTTNWKQTFIEEANICGCRKSLIFYIILFKRSISHKIKLFLKR